MNTGLFSLWITLCTCMCMQCWGGPGGATGVPADESGLWVGAGDGAQTVWSAESWAHISQQSPQDGTGKLQGTQWLRSKNMIKTSVASAGRCYHTGKTYPLQALQKLPSACLINGTKVQNAQSRDVYTCSSSMFISWSKKLCFTACAEKASAVFFAGVAIQAATKARFRQKEQLMVPVWSCLEGIGPSIRQAQMCS